MASTGFGSASRCFATSSCIPVARISATRFRDMQHTQASHLECSIRRERSNPIHLDGSKSGPYHPVILSEGPQAAVERSLGDWSHSARQHRAERDLSTSLKMTAFGGWATQSNIVG